MCKLYSRLPLTQEGKGKILSVKIALVFCFNNCKNLMTILHDVGCHAVTQLRERDRQTERERELQFVLDFTLLLTQEGQGSLCQDCTDKHGFAKAIP